ncbi:MAG: hypothetical protein LBK95_13880 [Bifidobacteriaceae bacterium]|nr:hypothetical protein [Bifidobacteriaceae bacterium]
MFRLGWAVASATHGLSARWGPVNRLIGKVRGTRDGLRWGVPAMGLGVVFFFAAASLAEAVRGGAPGWLNLLVLVYCWDGLRLTMLGPVSLVLLARRRWAERRAARAAGT